MQNDFESMKSSLLEQMCAILDKHEIAYQKSGVEKNLNCFGKNKAALIGLLSKHPNWDKDSLAVVYNAGYIRVWCGAGIEKLRLGLEDIAKEAIEKKYPKSSGETFAAFSEALKFLCNLPQFIENRKITLEVMKLTKVQCTVNQRVSRVVHKLCQKYDIDKHSKYVSVFTTLADALNPLALPHKTILSVNPCDFLEMSSGDDWISDFRLGTPDNRGSNIAGILSAMNDNVSMVLYTISKLAAMPYHHAAKVNSEFFCYNHGIFSNPNFTPTITMNRLKLSCEILPNKHWPSAWNSQIFGC